MNASRAINLFICSNSQFSTNGLATQPSTHNLSTYTTHSPSIPSEGGLTFKTSDSLSVHSGSLTLIKLFDTKV